MTAFIPGARDMTMTNYDDKTIRDVAQIAHEANRAYCASLGDHSQLPWDDAAAWREHFGGGTVEW